MMEELGNNNDYLMKNWYSKTFFLLIFNLEMFKPPEKLKKHNPQILSRVTNGK